jgi:hemoglobin
MNIRSATPFVGVLSLLLALGAALPLTARADADPAVLTTFGGPTGLSTLATDFVARLKADPRTQPFFKDSNAPELARKLADQFCDVLGGRCGYKGAEMKVVHDSLEIRKQDFNALVEVLQAAMDAQGIPFMAQNQLLARLAPMHRDVINTR